MDDSEESQLNGTARTLLVCALGLWALSLLLPAFAVTGDTTFGWQALVFGILLGWAAIGGWAAYANIFFFVSATLIWRNRSPMPWLLVALMLVCTLPFFDELRLPGDGSSNVVSWGWGAVVWVLAHLILLSAAYARSEDKSRKFLRPVGLMAGCILAAFGWLNFTQWSKANSQERTLWLGPGMAFTLERLCETPLVMPADAVIPRGSSVVVDVDRELTTRSPLAPRIFLPETTREFRELREGREWDVFEFGGPPSELAVLSQDAPSQFALIARRSGSGAIIRVEERATNRILYEQPLRRMANPGQYFCPYPSNDATQTMTDAGGYDRAIEKALGLVVVDEPWIGRIEKTVAAEPCDLQAAPHEAADDMLAWDGRNVRLTSLDLAQAAGRCSLSYAVLVQVRVSSGTEPEYSAAVDLFDRKTLRPLRRYGYEQLCNLEEKKCSRVPKDQTLEAWIYGDEIIVVTQITKIRAP
jgi:hypothetical protein